MKRVETFAILPVRFYVFPGIRYEGVRVGRDYSLAALKQDRYRIVAVSQRNFARSLVRGKEDLASIGFYVEEWVSHNVVDGKKGSVGLVSLLLESGSVVKIESVKFDETLGCFVGEGERFFFEFPEDDEDAIQQTVLISRKIVELLNSGSFTNYLASQHIERVKSLGNFANQPPKVFLDYLREHWNSFLGLCYSILNVVGGNLVMFVDDYEGFFLVDGAAEHLQLIYNFLVSVPEKLAILEQMSVAANEIHTNETRLNYLRLLQHVISEEMKEHRDGVGDKEIDELLEKIESHERLPAELKEKLRDDLLSVGNVPSNPERPMIIRYVNFVLSLPWGIYKEPRRDMDEVRRILNESHYGLEDVKERILEYLALYLHMGKPPKGTILCFVGPPGTGKTSMAAAVAEALDLPFERISLGGVDDEAEIRGHRRTYVGAMAGRIVKGLANLKALNGVLFLDEIDKMGVSFRGRPDAALLDVLDPDRNFEFVDHYVEYPIDLSNILFICGANDIDGIPPVLANRLEFIYFSGYVSREKKEIVRGYLIPRIFRDWNLDGKLRISDEVVDFVVEKYGAFEGGVRQVKRSVESLIRKAIAAGVDYVDVRFAQENLPPPPPKVTLEKATGSFAGVFPVLVVEKSGEGAVSWLEIIKRSGEKSSLEGKPLSDFVEIVGIGDRVLEKSVSASFLWFHLYVTETLGLDMEPVKFYVSFPAVAIERRGPSAGVIIGLGFLCSYFGIKWDMGYAVTGELSPSGKILPVGGLPSKILAAENWGFDTIFLPASNEEEVRFWLNKRNIVLRSKLVFVEHVSEILDRMGLAAKLERLKGRKDSDAVSASG